MWVVENKYVTAPKKRNVKNKSEPSPHFYSQFVPLLSRIYSQQFVYPDAITIIKYFWNAKYANFNGIKFKNVLTKIYIE